jgi:probable HAF family extracellular repeat protein
MNWKHLAGGVLLAASLCRVADAQVVVWETTQGGNGHAYELIPQQVNWQQAHDAAMQRTPPPGFSAGHLPTICDFNENSFVSSSFARNVWLGFTDTENEGEWRWIDSTPDRWVESEADFTNTYVSWRNGRPEVVIEGNPPRNIIDFALLNGQNSPDLRSFWQSARGWEALDYLLVEYAPLGQSQPPCPTTRFPRSAVIETKYNPANRHTYMLLPASKWTQAEQSANSLGGHLVTINNEEENGWVWESFGGMSRRPWIGLSDAAREGVYVWSSGQPVTYTNWGTAQPSGPGEDYVEIGYDGPKWNDAGDTPSLDGGNHVSIIEIAPPHILAVQVGGLTWSGGPYRVPDGSPQQVLPLPWSRINQLSLVFDEKVVIPPGALRLTDELGNEVPIFGPFAPFGPGAVGETTAIWMMESFLPLGDYTLTLTDDATGDLGAPLDGEWSDTTSTESGDGAMGGDFVFTFRVLPGDVNQDGAVNILDWAEVRDRRGATPSDPDWSVYHDIDRRGSVDGVDFDLVPRMAFASLSPWGGSAAVVVPEPATFAAVAAVIGLAFTQRWRRLFNLRRIIFRLPSYFVLIALATFAFERLSSGSTVRELGFLRPGATATTPWAVSSHGSIVVGVEQRGANESEAFYWRDATGMLGLGDLLGGQFASYGTDLSRDGSIVVGYGSTSTATISGPEAFKWTEAGGMVGLGGQQFSIAEAIAADGSVIVGGNGNQACIWTAGGGLIGLGDLAGGAFNSRAVDVSADGSVIAGNGTSGFGPEAFFWTQATGIVGLGSLSANPFGSRATAISGDGKVIVGESGGQAFRWTRSTGMVELGTGPGPIAPIDINYDGSVIISANWVWDQLHGMRPLNNVLLAANVDFNGWESGEGAGAISADGRVIVGSGRYMGRSAVWLATLSELPLPGDADGDGHVTGRDLLIVARNLGTRMDAIPELGDFDGDRAVTIRDLAIVKANFGQGRDGTSVAIPEPAGTILIGPALFIVAVRRFRRSWNWRRR